MGVLVEFVEDEGKQKVEQAGDNNSEYSDDQFEQEEKEEEFLQKIE